MNEEIYQYLYEIIKSRANPNNGYNNDARMAYVSCMYMLEYAHNNNFEALKNYDYFNASLSGEILKAMFQKE